MWWTRFFCGVVLVLSFLLLIIPGIYLLVRFFFVESIVVAEAVSGRAAMRRSFELTKGRFWPTVGFGTILLMVLVVPPVLLLLPTIFISALDHWLIEAAVALICDVIAAYATVALLCGYQVYAREMDPPVPPLPEHG